MNSSRLLASLAPWLLFTTIATGHGPDFVAGAAATAGVALLVIAILSARTADRRRWKVIDAAGSGMLAAVALLISVGDGEIRRDATNYGRAACVFVLVLVLATSLRGVPFTEQYARERTPEAYWRSPVFRVLHRHATRAYAIAALAIAIANTASGWLESRGNLTSSWNLGLNWALPAAVILLAIGYTDWTTGRRRR